MKPAVDVEVVNYVFHDSFEVFSWNESGLTKDVCTNCPRWNSYTNLYTHVVVGWRLSWPRFSPQITEGRSVDFPNCNLMKNVRNISADSQSILSKKHQYSDLVRRLGPSKSSVLSNTAWHFAVASNTTRIFPGLFSYVTEWWGSHQVRLEGQSLALPSDSFLAWPRLIYSLIAVEFCFAISGVHPEYTL